MAKHRKRTAAERIVRARAALMIFQGYYGTLVYNLAAEENRAFPTAATDGRKLVYNPDFIDTKDDDEVLFTVAHEAAHCGNKHHLRRGNRDPKLWNIACDYVINADLIKAGIGKMPAGGLYEPKYAGLSAEDIYKILLPKPQPTGGCGQPQPGEGGEGEGDGGQGEGGDADDDADDEEGEGEGGGGGDDDDADDAEDQPGAGGGNGDEDGGDAEGDEGEGGGGDADDQDAEQDAGDGDGDQDQGDDGQDQDAGQGGQGGPETGDDQGQGRDTQGGGKAAGDAPAQADGQDDAGMGQATCGDPGGCGEILDAPGDADELADQERHWDTVVRQAINVATKAAGKTPGHLERLVNELGRPVNNWRETLRRFVDQSTRLDYSWRRPDRRFAAADFLMPGAVSDGVNHVVIVNDTSASLYADKPQKRFATEIQSLLDENVVDRITLIDCDNRINGVQTFEAGDVVKFTNRGGGGTSFKPVWEWLKDNQEDTACVVYFTDLEPCDGYGTEPDLPVLWATYGDPRTVRPLMDKVPFGECVEVAE